jgi:hypothetical protein
MSLSAPHPTPARKMRALFQQNVPLPNAANRPLQHVAVRFARLDAASASSTNMTKLWFIPEEMMNRPACECRLCAAPLDPDRYPRLCAVPVQGLSVLALRRKARSWDKSCSLSVVERIWFGSGVFRRGGTETARRRGRRRECAGAVPGASFLAGPRSSARSHCCSSTLWRWSSPPPLWCICSKRSRGRGSPAA